jgi:hypothetical protein
MRGLKWVGGALAASVAGSAPAAPAPRSFADAAPAVRTTTLANGLQIIVWPDHNIPNVALYNWVHVGSRNEGTGTTGLAHFFEHMMFNGTSRHPQGEFDRLMEAQGASNNAYTSQDVTVYQDWFPRSALELVFELESDRLANLAFVPEVVENERKVVYSERRLRVEDSNAALLEEQVQATAFLAHPYRIPTIGWPSDIQSWTMADLQNFFHTYYAPNNCTLVLVGAVDPDQVFALAQQYFAAMPARERRRRCVPASRSSSASGAWCSSGPGRIRWCTVPITRLRPPIRASRRSTSCRPSSWAGMPRACIARWWRRQKLAVAIGGGWSEGFDANMFVHSRDAARGRLGGRVRAGPGCRTCRDRQRRGDRAGTAPRQEHGGGGFLARRVDHRRQGAAAGRIRGHARRLQAAVCGSRGLRARHARGRGEDCTSGVQSRQAHRRRAAA